MPLAVLWVIVGMRPEDFLVLLIDDEPDILDIVGYCLEKEGFRVITAPGGAQGIRLAEKELPNLILLDVMMPEMDGIEVCEELRKKPELKETRIAFLTARTEDYSQIAGLEAGGDDYIAKPIKPRLLLARIKALLKQNVGLADGAKAVKAGDIVIDVDRRVVLKGETTIELAKKEFDLLHLLMAGNGRVLTREHIYSKLWKNDFQVGDRTIDVHVLRLRNKIGEQAIKTIKGVGYRFNQNATQPE
ncbi:MAG: two-component system alkaline phosphatase synthesis response regulator PhoP [Bacteroidia bacterium]